MLKINRNKAIRRVSIPGHINTRWICCMFDMVGATRGIDLALITSETVCTLSI